MPITITADAPLSANYFDILTNGNHRNLSDGTPYGAWVDGPIQPWRDRVGNTYFNIPHSENYRMRIPDWNNPYTWVMDGSIMISPRRPLESAYDGRQWLFGFHAIGNTVYALAHNEFYIYQKTVDGHRMFNDHSRGPNTFWSTCPVWAKSTNGGASFRTKRYRQSLASNSNRAVLVPEPHGVQNLSTLYGFLHPSNIVQEGGYCYAFVDHRKLHPNNRLTGGFSIIRTSNLEKSTGWQFWNGAEWETVNHNYYQSNLSQQQPYIFYSQTNWNPYKDYVTSAMMALCIRKHTPSDKWILFGVSGSPCFTVSETLADPREFETNGRNFILNGLYEGLYLSVFDHDALDQNFTAIGDTPMLYVTKQGQTAYFRQQLTITNY